MMKLEVSGGMITDKELLETWPSCSDMDINDKKIWFARQVIRMAQEVRPLVFGRKHTVLRSQTSFGEYTIYYYNPDEGYVIELSSSEEEIGDVYETEAEAIAAAQADFNRRVLENLTHGGAE